MSPSTGLVDGTQVSVTLSGLAADTNYSVQECRGSDLITCDPSTSRSMPTDGSGGASIPDFTIKRLVSFGDCLMETCVIAATGGLEATPPNVPIDFAPVLMLSQNMGLADPASVTVSGEHFTAGATYTIAHCTGAGCDMSNTVQATADQNRSLPTTAFTLHRVITVNDQAVDCSTTLCSVEALGHETPPPSVGVTFVAAQLFVMPNTGLNDPASVGVWASNMTAGAEYSIEECAGSPLTAANCDPSTAVTTTAQADGSIAQFPYQVKKTITVGGNPVDCGTASCVVAALGGGAPTPPSVPISFMTGPQPPAGLTVTPNTMLADLQVVKVSGSSLHPSTTYSLQECTQQGCDGSTAVAVTTGQPGGFPATNFTVHRSITVGGNSVDCRTASCLIAALGGGENPPPYKLIQFAQAPVITLGGLLVSVKTETGNAPPTGLNDLDKINVSGGGNSTTIVKGDTTYGLYQCASTPSPSGPTLVCDPTTRLSVTTNHDGFMGTDQFVVHRVINGSTDCMTTQCWVQMLDDTQAAVTGPAQLWFAGSTLQPAAVVGTVSLCVQRDTNGNCTWYGKSSKIFDDNGNVDARYPTLVLLCPGTTPGCQNYTVLGLNNNDVYGNNQLPALGGSYDVQAVQLDASTYPNVKVLRTSPDYHWTPTPGQVTVKDLVLSDCLSGQTCPTPAAGEFLTGKVTDQNGNVLPADPYGGGGIPLTGVAICPWPQTYQNDPSAACNGGTVRLAPTNAAGIYLVWVPAGKWNVTPYSFLAPPKAVPTLWTAVTITAVDPVLDLVVPTAATLSYTGPTAVLSGATVTLSGSVIDQGAPVADQHLRLSLGSQSCKAWTGPNGVATCEITVAQPAGIVQGSVAFAVDPSYRPSPPVNVRIGQTPTVTWTPNPATILFGTPLGTAQLHASASFGATTVPGTFVYRVQSGPLPAGTLLTAGMVLPPGVYTARADFTPTDTVHFTTASATGVTLTVGFSRACITTPTSGALKVLRGQAICIGPGGKVSGSVTVQSGGSLWISGGTIGGSVTSTAATAVTIGGATIGGSLTITGSTGPVNLSGNRIGGSVTITGSRGGVTYVGNRAGGSVTITNNTGGFVYSGNTAGGRTTLTNNR